MQGSLFGFVLILVAIAAFVGCLRLMGVKLLRCPILQVEFKPQNGRTAPKGKGKDDSV